MIAIERDSTRRLAREGYADPIVFTIPVHLAAISDTPTEREEQPGAADVVIAGHRNERPSGNRAQIAYRTA